MFFAYFCSRYSESIVAAAFTNTSELQRVAVFEQGRITNTIKRNRYGFLEDVQAQAIARRADYIYSYDGSPSFAPTAPARVVCFTSPSADWFRQMLDEETALTLYMPLWGMEELVTAANCLQLGLLGPPVTRATVEERRYFFGGVARDCLRTIEVELPMLRVRREIHGVNILDLGRLRNGIWAPMHYRI